MPIAEDKTWNAERAIRPVSKRKRQTDKGGKAFDFTCRHYLNMSSSDFLERYKLQSFDGLSETGVQRVLAMLPFAL